MAHNSEPSASRGRSRPRGHATLQALGLAALFALALSALGPVLDEHPYSGYGYQAPAIEAGEIARLEADARHRCARDRGENTGVVFLPDGAIVCTDKHGQRARSQITTLVRAQR